MSPFSVSSSRWSPTPEQLMILEEMYRSGGIRTPNASQIQQITSHLSHYGKIEGKNVFYWFQNHKARDRQRLRRKLAKLQLYQHIKVNYNHLQDHRNHCLSCVDNSSTSVHQLAHPNSTGILQECGVDHNPSAHMKKGNYTWKLNQTPEVGCQSEEDPMVVKSYGCDWTTRLNVCPPTFTKPLETLELFPITSARGLKEDYTTQKHVPSSLTN